MSVASPVRTVVRRRRRSVARKPTITAAAVAALNASRDDPDWVQDLRRASFAAWERLPLPTPTTEGWRRTDLRPITSRLHTVKPAASRNNRHDVALGDLDTGLQEALDVRFPVGRAGHPAGLHDRPPDPGRRARTPGRAVHGHPRGRARASRSGAAVSDESRAGGLAARRAVQCRQVRVPARRLVVGGRVYLRPAQHGGRATAADAPMDRHAGRGQLSAYRRRR